MAEFIYREEEYTVDHKDGMIRIDHSDDKPSVAYDAQKGRIIIIDRKTNEVLVNDNATDYVNRELKRLEINLEPEEKEELARKAKERFDFCFLDKYFKGLDILTKNPAIEVTNIHTKQKIQFDSLQELIEFMNIHHSSHGIAIYMSNNRELAGKFIIKTLKPLPMSKTRRAKPISIKCFTHGSKIWRDAVDPQDLSIHTGIRDYDIGCVLEKNLDERYIGGQSIFTVQEFELLGEERILGDSYHIGGAKAMDDYIKYSAKYEREITERIERMETQLRSNYEQMLLERNDGSSN